MRTRWFLSIAIVILALITGAPVAHAVCTNPDRVAGSIVFNKDHRVMQYCDDTNWIAVGRDAPEPCPVGIVSCGGKEDERVFFVTDAEMRGNLGGISGADSICQTEAEAANLQGTYLAWLTDSNTSNAPASRFEQSDVPYVRVDGTIIANDWSDLTDGSLTATTDLNPFGISEDTNWAFTNTQADGTQISAVNHCSNFTSGGGPITFGDLITNTTWGQSTSLACSSDRHLYCFEQGATELTSIVPDGLIGHWKLDETSVTDAIDYAGSNNGSMTSMSGAANSTPARVITGLTFDGSNDYITVPDSATFDLPAGLSLTVGAWFRIPDGFDCNDDADNKVIVSYFGGTPAWWIGCDKNTQTFKWVFRTSDNNLIQLSGPTTINDGQWHYGVGMYDNAADEARIYLDGVLENSAPLNATGNLIVARPVCIGGFGATCDWTAPRWHGDIDDVRIYNRALTAEEIKYLYKSFDANITYDADRRVPKYFNGDDWVAMGESKYVPNAVDFDQVGGTYLLDNAGYNAGASQQLTISYWFKRDSGSSNDYILDADGTSFPSIRNYLTSGNEVFMQIRDASDTTIFGDATPTVYSFGEWNHYMMSVDFATGDRHVYFNDVDQGCCSTFVGGGAFRILILQILQSAHKLIQALA